MNIFVEVGALTKPYPQVIKVGDTCYELVGGVQQAADTPTIDGEFEDCDDCAADVSYSSQSSQGLSSSSSQGISSSSSSLGLSSSSSSQGISSDSSQSAENSSSSSQSGAAALCVGKNCNGGADPSIQLIVTGASGTINWCGETWNLPADSGVPKCVCPLIYKAPFFSSAGYFGHWWKYSAGLTIQRGNNFQGNDNHEVRLWTSGFSAFYDLRYSAFTNFNIGVLNTTSAFVSAGDYKIPIDAWEGDHTVSGIKYEWAKGDNWP